MFRTTLSVVFAMTLMTTTARANDELAPASTLLTANAVDSIVRFYPAVNPVINKVLEAEAAPAQLNLARPLQLKRPFVLPALYAGFATLQVYDAYSTMTALKHGGREANPLMSGIVNHPAAFIALKGATTAVSIYAAEKMWRQHQRAKAIVVMAVSNGVMAMVAAHNASVVRQLR